MPTKQNDPKLDGLHSQIVGDFFSKGDPRVLNWIREAVAEGERVNRSDPSWPNIDQAMQYVLGEQLPGNRPPYLTSVVVNQTKKAIRTHVSALTDIRPLFSFRSQNPKFQLQGDILNKRTVAWWVNTFADLALADAIKYALTAGCSDVLLEYDPSYQSGENRMIARDPRDTLPIRPGRSGSIQEWEGVILRDAFSPNALRAAYPDYGDTILRESDAGTSWGWSTYTRFRQRQAVSSGIISPVLEGLATPATMAKGSPEVHLYRVFLKDRSRNLTEKPILMGKPGTNWAYTTGPGEALYPRGRLIVCTERAVIYDGPNPYWHGMFPVARLRLDPWPWSFLGLGLTHDLMPIQDAINRMTNDMLTVFSQSVNRGTIADSKAVPESVHRRFDPRAPNWKMRVNNAMGEAFKLVDPPQLPAWAMNLLQLLVQKHEDLAEMANLQELLKLRQMPSGDTIEKYYNAMTPGLRQEGRLLEAFLREIAEMLKVNFFQFESKAKRIMMLGEAGETLDDLDWDPDNMIPAMAPEDPGYVKELDKALPLHLRAQFFHKLFTFWVAPNSILAMHAQEQQMKYVQLARQGYLDYWTLMEMLEVPGVGAPPPIPLPMKDWKPEEHVDPATGIPQPPPLVIRDPITITERLQAQMQLGIGQTVSSAGRKASGQEPPKAEEKSDGEGGKRTTITESRK